MATDLKTHIADSIREAKTLYLKDLAAMPAEQLAVSPGGLARTPYDFTYEVDHVNRRIAARLKGEEPPPYFADGWMRAPEEFKDKDAALKALEESTEDVLDAWEALEPDELDKPIQTPGGETTALELGSLAAKHLMYHCAQLNYVQALHGDAEMHWS